MRSVVIRPVVDHEDPYTLGTVDITVVKSLPYRGHNFEEHLPCQIFWKTILDPRPGDYKLPKEVCASSTDDFAKVTFRGKSRLKKGFRLSLGSRIPAVVCNSPEKALFLSLSCKNSSIDM
jgi:hypothetical protein